MESRIGTLLAILLTVSLLGLGGYEVYEHRDSSFRVLMFWGLSLIGSAAVVGAGVLSRPRFPNVGTALLVIGSVVAAIPTLRTLVLPILELGVIALALRDHARTARAA